MNAPELPDNLISMRYMRLTALFEVLCAPNGAMGDGASSRYPSLSLMGLKKGLSCYDRSLS